MAEGRRCTVLGLSIRRQDIDISGKIVYGSESDIEKLIENRKLHKFRTGVILNSYDGQLNVEDGKYESGKHFSCRETVGKGCFGCVKVCIDTKNRSEGVFVMKEIDIEQMKEMGMKEKGSKSVLREVKALCRLKHEHIVKLIGVIVEPDKIYILMENGGVPIKKKIEGVPETHRLLKVIEWFTQLLSGLAYMHKTGDVHCDLHFGNILIDDQDMLKICDLGSVKDVDELLFTISHGYTVHYFPPSVIKLYFERKRQQKLDSSEKQNILDTLQRTVAPRLDLYALGKLLLEIVTGSDMITVKDLKTAIESKEDWDHFLQETIPAKCSEKVKYLITNLMSYTTDDGFKSAQDALDALKVLEKGCIEEKMSKKNNNGTSLQPMPPFRRDSSDMEEMDTD